MKKILILICLLLVVSCVAGQRSEKRNRLYTTYGFYD